MEIIFEEFFMITYNTSVLNIFIVWIKNYGKFLNF